MKVFKLCSIIIFYFLARAALFENRPKETERNEVKILSLRPEYLSSDKSV